MRIRTQLCGSKHGRSCGSETRTGIQPVAEELPALWSAGTRFATRRTNDTGHLFAEERDGSFETSSNDPLGGGRHEPGADMNEVFDDLTHPPAPGRQHETGAQRTHRPAYVSLLPPCSHACPAGENVQAWLAHVQAGRFEDAWRVIMQANPLPAVHGRVCYHPCETECNRSQLDGAVSIHAVERFLGDLGIQNGWMPVVSTGGTGGRVLVIGAGPSGLSAAYHLALAGHAVEIRDAGAVPGGMLRFGIPAYRLPRQTLQAEIERIERLGVRFVMNHRVTDLLREKQEGRFEAVFVAVGSHVSRRVDIPARDAGRIMDAVGFLRNVAEGQHPRLGRRVAIYGGGNTAMDAARVALRLGHDPVIIYRRDREHMPAHAFEADEALEEGIQIQWLRSIRTFDGPKMTVEIMELDGQGSPRGTGRFEDLEADDLILALGQTSDTDFLRGVDGIQFQDDGTVIVSRQMMTGHPGIFAGGDMVPAERTVTTAVGHGRRAAQQIDAWLKGTTIAEAKSPELATFDKLRLWYFTGVEQRPQPRRDPGRRVSGFDEVLLGLSQEQAAFEARRCFSCGNCFHCDGCLAACPEDAIVRQSSGAGYDVLSDKCTGCRICVDQCPCHAMEMIPERPFA